MIRLSKIRCIPLYAVLLWIVPPSVDAQTAGQTQSDVRRINGYRGIWFTLGQYYGPGDSDQDYAPRQRAPVFPYGDKYSGGLATYTAKHVPLAIHAPEVNKTFFVFGGAPKANERYLLCMIGYFDHETGSVPKPVVVHDKQGVDDPHDNPSLSIDDQGYLWVFVSGRARSRPGFKYRSRKPWDIDGFDLIAQEELTYPQPQRTGAAGFLHLFTKYTGRRELYFESSEDGFTWTSDQKLAGIREPGDQQGGHYQTSAVHQEVNGRDVVGTFMNRHPNGDVDRRTDIYYVQTNDQGKTWTTVDGLALETPLSEVASPARVADYASRNRNVYLKNMAFDQSGHPVLLYVTSNGHQPGPPNGPRQLEVVRWTGEQWVTSVVTTVDHNYDMGSLVIQGDQWNVYAPTDPGPQPHHGGGEIVRWLSVDQGATWRRSATVTSGSLRNHNYVR
ncbi:MAG: BNR-4 repeat-containing protein, partial [Planctomycetota bacterium]